MKQKAEQDRSGSWSARSGKTPFKDLAAEHIPWVSEPTGSGTWVDRELRPISARRQVQRKALTVQPAGDAYEREADAVADRVVAADPVDVAGQGPTPFPTPVAGSISSVVQRDASPSAASAKGSGSEVSDDVSKGIEATKGGGKPLDAETSAQMSSAFGQEFSQVRVHTDGKAGELAGQLGARAFTHGSDVYMGKGQSGPETKEGRHLLAHELTHVVQQGAAGGAVQRKPIIQRDPEAGMEDGAGGGGGSEAAPEADAKKQPSSAKVHFVGTFYPLWDRLKDDPASRNLASVQTALAGFEPVAKQTEDPRYLKILSDTIAFFQAVYSKPPLPVEVALSRSEAAALKAYGKKIKHEELGKKAKYAITEDKKKLGREAWYQPTGTRITKLSHEKLAKKHFTKANEYKDRIEALLGADAPTDVVTKFVNALADPEVAKAKTIVDAFTAMQDETLLQMGSVRRAIHSLVACHVAADVIETYERLSGKTYNIA